jgi:hypothetical protein
MGGVLPDGTIICDTPKEIEAYRLLTLRKALELEILGIRVFRATTAYAVIKREFKLHGNRQRVHDQFTALLREREILV